MRLNHLRRREFITLLGGAAATWPLAARAQEPGRTYRLGTLGSSPRDAPHHIAFFAEMQKLGFIEGQNLAIDRRGYGRRAEEFAELASERTKPARTASSTKTTSGIVAVACWAAATIPLVVLVDDAVRAGLVRSLASSANSSARRP